MGGSCVDRSNGLEVLGRVTWGVVAARGSRVRLNSGRWSVVGGIPGVPWCGRRAPRPGEYRCTPGCEEPQTAIPKAFGTTVTTRRGVGG